MTTIAYLKYIGSDPETYSQIESYFASKKNKEIEYICEALSENDLDLERILTMPKPNVIFLDLTEIHKSFHDLWLQLSLSKNHEEFKKIPVIGFYKSKEHLKSFRMTLYYGVHYAFIKGNEIKIMLQDSELLAFNELDNTKFAKANLNNLPYTVKSPILLSEITEDGMCFDADLDVDNEITVDNIPAANAPQKLIISEKIESSFSSDSIFHYKCKFNLPGAWDDIDPNMLQTDTINTYLDNHSDEFAKYKQSLFIASSNTNIIFRIIQNKKKISFNIMFHNQLQIKKILLIKPSLIFINCESTDYNESLAELTEIMNSDSAYLPIIILFNNNDSTANLKNIYKYENLLSYHAEINTETVFKLLKMFEASNKRNIEDNAKVNLYRLFDSDRCAKILHEVKMTSITEHEITFYSKQPLIMFTNIRIDIPIKAHILIVPSVHKVNDSEEKGTHYRGLIHGVEFQDTNTLRQFVNYAISKELKEFKLPDIVIEKKEIELIENEQKDNEFKQVDSNVINLDKDYFKVERKKWSKTKL